jgi:hypothetical protein
LVFRRRKSKIDFNEQVLLSGGELEFRLPITAAGFCFAVDV